MCPVAFDVGQRILFLKMHCAHIYKYLKSQIFVLDSMAKYEKGFSKKITQPERRSWEGKNVKKQ
jgi:hypothetical protein